MSPNTPDRMMSGSVAVTPSCDLEQPQRLPKPGASFGSRAGARLIFTEAEKIIIEKGREVAEKVVELQHAEHQLKQQQEATAQSWGRTQQGS
jgi:hypothetical protein